MALNWEVQHSFLFLVQLHHNDEEYSQHVQPQASHHISTMRKIRKESDTTVHDVTVIKYILAYCALWSP